MARYQPPGGRGQQPRGTSPGRQLPPPDSVLRQRAVAALSLGFLSLLGLALGLGNLRRGILVAAVALVFGLTAIWLGAGTSKRARRSGTARPRGAIAGVVLGSLGNPLGTALGGVVYGICYMVVQTYLSSWADLLPYVLLIFILLLRPSGLLGRRVRVA